MTPGSRQRQRSEPARVSCGSGGTSACPTTRPWRLRWPAGDDSYRSSYGTRSSSGGGAPAGLSGRMPQRARSFSRRRPGRAARGPGRRRPGRGRGQGRRRMLAADFGPYGTPGRRPSPGPWRLTAAWNGSDRRTQLRPVPCELRPGSRFGSSRRSRAWTAAGWSHQTPPRSGRSAVSAPGRARPLGPTPTPGPGRGGPARPTASGGRPPGYGHIGTGATHHLSTVALLEIRLPPSASGARSAAGHRHHDRFAAELCWREFYADVLFNHPNRPGGPTGPNGGGSRSNRCRGRRPIRGLGRRAAPAIRSWTPGCDSSRPRRGCTTGSA